MVRGRPLPRLHELQLVEDVVAVAERHPVGADGLVDAG
jgi:hypothetical protein